MASRQHNQRSKTLGNKYMLGDEIGRGKYGRVYKGLDLENGDFVAIKQVSLENIPQEILDTIMQEIDLLKNLNHKNIVKYLGSLKTNSHLHIILEYMQNGSLANIVKPNKFGPLPESLAAVYIAQVLEGLVYLHEQGVVHRDIKGSNIFTTNEGLVKLADFGEATKLIEADVNTHSVVGTPYWMAPEVIEMSGVSAASDIWSVGCTVIELFTSSPPYYELQPMPALFRIVQDVHPPIPKEFSPEITDFLRQCLQKDAIQRPDAKTLLMHPWLQNSRRALLSVRQPDQPARDTTTGERLHSETMEPTSLTMRLLEKITNNFSNERLLGQGAYGKVYRGVRDGQEIAVKLLYNNVQTINDEQFIREFDNLMMLNHPNIVRLVGYCYETQRQHMEFEGRTVFGETTYKALCFEYMPKGSLQKHLSDECNGLDWQTRYKIIKGACEGLKYLHEGLKKPFYHLDLKPDNILLDENMVPKLADFGSSKLFGEEQTRTTQNLIGTIGYLPPEYLFGNLVSNKLDIFGLGVVMTKIIAGPSGHTRHAEMHYQKFLDQVQGNWRKRLQATWSFPELLEAQCRQVQRCTEIALSCMEMDRHKRPSIVDIIHELDKTEICIEKVIPWST